MSIRTKLAIWYGALVTAILVLLSGVYFEGYKRMLQNQKDYSIQVVADILDSSIPRKIPSKETAEKAVARIIHDYPDIVWKGILIEVYDSSRSILFSSSRSETERLPVTDTMWRKALRGETDLATLSLRRGMAPMRILAKPVLNRNDLLYLIQVGSSMQNIESTLAHFLWLNLLFIPTAALLVAAGGWLLTRRALKPLGSVIKTAHRISSGDLRHRIEATETSEELRELATALNQMIARLEASFEQIRDFSDNVSHELRIPLAILKGQTELSLRRSRSEEEYRKVLESNLEEIERMKNIVDRLLFLSRADRGEIKLNFTRVDLSSLMENVLSQFRVPAQEKGIQTALKMNGPVTIIGDDLLLRELLLNLVQNAITYTPQAGEVTLSLEKENDLVKISVTDSGCGIPESEIPRIFDRFYQVDPSRASQGSGLGLSICKWIVDAHQGMMDVESQVGQGSRFTVSFPHTKD